MNTFLSFSDRHPHLKILLTVLLAVCVAAGLCWYFLTLPSDMAEVSSLHGEVQEELEVPTRAGTQILTSDIQVAYGVSQGLSENKTPLTLMGYGIVRDIDDQTIPKLIRSNITVQVNSTTYSGYLFEMTEIVESMLDDVLLPGETKESIKGKTFYVSCASFIANQNNISTGSRVGVPGGLGSGCNPFVVFLVDQNGNAELLREGAVN